MKLQKLASHLIEKHHVDRPCGAHVYCEMDQLGILMTLKVNKGKIGGAEGIDRKSRITLYCPCNGRKEHGVPGSGTGKQR